MQKMRLVVEVQARLDWIEPPKDMSEEAMREYANSMAAKAGKQLEPAVQLLVADLLNAQTPNAKILDIVF